MIGSRHLGIGMNESEEITLSGFVAGGQVGFDLTTSTGYFRASKTTSTGATTLVTTVYPSGSNTLDSTTVSAVGNIVKLFPCDASGNKVPTGTFTTFSIVNSTLNAKCVEFHRCSAITTIDLSYHEYIESISLPFRSKLFTTFNATAKGGGAAIAFCGATSVDFSKGWFALGCLDLAGCRYLKNITLSVGTNTGLKYISSGFYPFAQKADRDIYCYPNKARGRRPYVIPSYQSSTDPAVNVPTHPQFCLSLVLETLELHIPSLERLDIVGCNRLSTLNLSNCTQLIEIWWPNLPYGWRSSSGVTSNLTINMSGTNAPYCWCTGTYGAAGLDPYANSVIRYGLSIGWQDCLYSLDISKNTNLCTRPWQSPNGIYTNNGLGDTVLEDGTTTTPTTIVDNSRALGSGRTLMNNLLGMIYNKWPEAEFSWQKGIANWIDLFGVGLNTTYGFINASTFPDKFAKPYMLAGTVNADQLIDGQRTSASGDNDYRWPNLTDEIVYARINGMSPNPAYGASGVTSYPSSWGVANPYVYDTSPASGWGAYSLHWQTAATRLAILNMSLGSYKNFSEVPIGVHTFDFSGSCLMPEHGANTTDSPCDAYGFPYDISNDTTDQWRARVGFPEWHTTDIKKLGHRLTIWSGYASGFSIPLETRSGYGVASGAVIAPYTFCLSDAYNIQYFQQYYSSNPTMNFNYTIAPWKSLIALSIQNRATPTPPTTINIMLSKFASDKQFVSPTVSDITHPMWNDYRRGIDTVSIIGISSLTTLSITSNTEAYSAPVGSPAYNTHPRQRVTVIGSPNLATFNKSGSWCTNWGLNLLDISSTGLAGLTWPAGGVIENLIGHHCLKLKFVALGATGANSTNTAYLTQRSIDFEGCNLLKSVTLPTTTNIPQYTFMYFKGCGLSAFSATSVVPTTALDDGLLRTNGSGTGALKPWLLDIRNNNFSAPGLSGLYYAGLSAGASNSVTNGAWDTGGLSAHDMYHRWGCLMGNKQVRGDYPPTRTLYVYGNPGAATHIPKDATARGYTADNGTIWVAKGATLASPPFWSGSGGFTGW